MKCILASSSPRRKKLMSMLNIPYEVEVQEHEEVFDEHLNNYDNCVNIAYQKAKIVFDKHDEDLVVIGCDTIVVNNGEVYGKPKDYDDAYRMLRNLSGHEHEVVSGVCIITRKDNHIYVEKDYSKCLVYVDKISDDEISTYLNNCQPYDKAGAYAIQEEFGKYINKIDGDYYTIVGFPVNLVYKLLKKVL